MPSGCWLAWPAPGAPLHTCRTQLQCISSNSSCSRNCSVGCKAGRSQGRGSQGIAGMSTHLLRIFQSPHITKAWATVGGQGSSSPVYWAVYWSAPGWGSRRRAVDKLKNCTGCRGAKGIQHVHFPSTALNSLTLSHSMMNPECGFSPDRHPEV